MCSVAKWCEMFKADTFYSNLNSHTLLNIGKLCIDRTLKRLLSIKTFKILYFSCQGLTIEAFKVPKSDAQIRFKDSIKTLMND